MKTRKAVRVGMMVFLIVVTILVTAIGVLAQAEWQPPEIDGFREPLWEEEGKNFKLWRAGNPEKPNPLIDGEGWALWDKGLPETQERDVYVAILVNSRITNNSFDENWIRANSASGPKLSFEKIRGFWENNELVGWEARVTAPESVCKLYVHTVTDGQGGVEPNCLPEETAAGVVDICKPTAVRLSTIGAAGLGTSKLLQGEALVLVTIILVGLALMTTGILGIAQAVKGLKSLRNLRKKLG